MENRQEMIRMQRVDRLIYPRFRDRIIDLYLNAFTAGDYAQYISPGCAAATLDHLLQVGWGWISFVEEKPIGLILSHPLIHDPDFPAALYPAIPVKSSVYIAEMMVDATVRGRGIALRMIHQELLSQPPGITHAVIRVWEENRPALSLYERVGFVPFHTIRQTKHRSPAERFTMKKIYLYKRLTPA